MRKMSKLLILLLAIALVIGFAPTPTAQAADLTLFDNNNVVSTGNYTVMADNWGAQTFTTTTSYTLTEVRLAMLREGSPGYAYLSLRAVDSGGDPTGAALSTGELNANAFTTDALGAWYTFVMTPYDLEYDTQYALVLSAPSGYANNTVYWGYVVAGALPNGEKLTSITGGVTWTPDAGEDFTFECWGYTGLAINSVRVWSNFREEGDWLITAYYTNTVAPQYPDESIENYWDLQLLTSNCTGNVTAQTPIRYWGHRVGSIYLSASQVETLDWGGNYSVRLYSETLSVCYELAPDDTDWRGQNMRELDSWCIWVAKSMGTADGRTYTAEIVDRGDLINAAAGPYFSNGIPRIACIRQAHLFQEYECAYELADYDFVNEMQAETDMEERLGPYVYGVMETASTAFSIPTFVIGFIVIAVMYFMMAAVVPPGHAVAGMIISVPLLFIGLYTGTFLWLWYALIALVAIALFIWHFVLTR